MKGNAPKTASREIRLWGFSSHAYFGSVKPGLVKPIRQLNSFPVQLPDALDGSNESRRRSAHVNERILNPKGELWRGMLKLCDLRERGLVIDRILRVMQAAVP